jgi:pilus assembly protein Flp/PilA
MSADVGRRIASIEQAKSPYHLDQSALTLRTNASLTLDNLSLRRSGAEMRLGGRRMDMAEFLKLIKNREGATAIEYGLIAALIAVAAIGAMQGIGNKLNTTFNNVSNHLG